MSDAVISQKSSVTVKTNSKGVLQPEIKVYAETTREELKEAVDLAVAEFARLNKLLGLKS